MIEYAKLKQAVVLAASQDKKGDTLVPRLKEIFRQQINSPRRSEQIHSVADLIQVLEKRDELTENNVVLLKTIAAAVHGGSELECDFAKYNDYILNASTQSANTSYYDCNQNVSVQSGLTLHTAINSKKRYLIYERIANEIGSHWRDLARNLEIREGQIERISSEYNNNAQRVTRVLEVSESKSDPCRWFYQLSDALESARRTDLRKILQEIIMMNV